MGAAGERECGKREKERRERGAAGGKGGDPYYICNTKHPHYVCNTFPPRKIATILTPLLAFAITIYFVSIVESATIFCSLET